MALLSSRALPPALAPNSNDQTRHPSTPSTSPTTVLVLLPCGSAFLISCRRRDPVDWPWDRQHPQSINGGEFGTMCIIRACPTPKNECSHSKMEAVSFKGSLNPKQHFPQSISIVQNPNPPWPGGQLSLRISASILAFSAYLPPAINIHHWTLIPGGIATWSVTCLQPPTTGLYGGCSPHIYKAFQSSRGCGSRGCRSRVPIFLGLKRHKTTMVVASKFWSYRNSMAFLLHSTDISGGTWSYLGQNAHRSGLHDQAVHPIKSACHVVGAKVWEAGTPSAMILVFLLFLTLFLVAKPLL